MGGKRFFRDSRFIIMFVLVSIMMFNGVAIYVVESRYPNSPIKSLSDAFWWLLVTISTVGYGDIVPQSGFGKFLGSVTIVVGVAFFTVVTGSIASLLVEMRLQERKGLGRVKERNHTVILGKNESLPRLLENLASFGRERVVLVADMEEDEFQTLAEHFPNMDLKFVKGDYTRDQVLRRAAIGTASTVIILADTSRGMEDMDERTLIAVLAVRSISSSVKVIVEVVKEEKVKHIIRAGADEVVRYGEFNPIIMGSFAVSPALHAFITNILNEGKFGVEVVPRSFVGRRFRDLFEHLRSEKGIMVIGLISERKKVAIEDILTGDHAIDEFLKRKLEEAEVDVFNEVKEFSIKLNPDDDYEISDDDSFVVYMG